MAAAAAEPAKTAAAEPAKTAAGPMIQDQVPFLVRRDPKREGAIKAETTPKLLKAWDTDVTAESRYVDRDYVARTLWSRGERPDAWTSKWESDGAAYPSVEDRDFAAKLMRKTEFQTLQSRPPGAPGTACGDKKQQFTLTPIQNLIARFLHPSTPYKGILLDHGVGVGKTCTAVNVAELYLEAMPHKSVFILAPQAIADGFRSTIFDASKLVEATKEQRLLTGERWLSPQCTGMTYLRLSGMANHADRDEIQKEVDKWIKQRYHIMGYFKFYNWIQEQMREALSSSMTAEEREDTRKSVLLRLFADKLLIIDEAQNLRDASLTAASKEEAEEETTPTKVSDAAGGKKLTPVLLDVLRYAEGLKLVLMTATPMYDTASEIVLLLNLLLLNDTKRDDVLLNARTLFTPTGELTKDKAQVDALIRVVKRYVSYMRGENPSTFPLRLTPPEARPAVITSFVARYPPRRISREEGLELADADSAGIFTALPLVLHELEPEHPVAAALHTVLSARYAEEKSLDTFNLDQAMQIGNLVYPDGSSGQMGFDAHFKETTSEGLAQLQWRGKTEMGAMWGSTEGLARHSPKIAAIVKSVLSARGLCFVYSRYIKSGVLPLAIALEMAGGCRVLADGTYASLLHGKPKGKPAFTYVLLTPNKSYSPDFEGLVHYATRFRNAEEATNKVKVILGSQVSAEGLDFKCIRELHLLDGWYHLNRVEQIEGRGIRYCSHALLPEAERNCLLYLHAVAIPEYETPDLYAYRVATRKAKQIGRVSRLLKEHAWDCGLNAAANQFPAFAKVATDAHGRDALEGRTEVIDTPYTSICDYMSDCGYACAVPMVAEGTPQDESTAQRFDWRVRLAEAAERLLHSIREETVRPLKDVLKTAYQGIPPDFALASIRELLGARKFKRHDGTLGTLVYKNGYIVFQPDKVTDTDIPVTFRYGRVMGRLPRTFQLKRPTFFSEMAPPPVAAATATTTAAATAGPAASAASATATTAEGAEESRIAAAAAVGFDDVLASTDAWAGLVSSRILTGAEGPLAPPPPFPKTAGAQLTLNGWRWVLHHFRDLGEVTLRIAVSWWADNIWTLPQRKAVLAYLCAKDPAAYTSIERLIRTSVGKSELFVGGDLKGYAVLEGEDEVAYCQQADGSVRRCASSMAEYVDEARGPAVDLEEGTQDLYGLLAFKDGTSVFKTMNKATGRPGGAECATASNLPGKQEILREVHRIARETLPVELQALLLDDRKETVPTDAEKKAQQDAVKERYEPPSKKPKNMTTDLRHINTLNLKQICPYTEFLFRWLDSRVGEAAAAAAAASPTALAPRSFLSAVDYVRAVKAKAKAAAKGKKGKEGKGVGKK